MNELTDALIGMLREACFIKWVDGKYVMLTLYRAPYEAAFKVLAKQGHALWDEERKGWVILD